MGLTHKESEMDTVFTLLIDGIDWDAVWFDKEVDRAAAWYIYRDGQKIGTFAGYPADRGHVENFIRFFLAGKLANPDLLVGQ